MLTLIAFVYGYFVCNWLIRKHYASFGVALAATVVSWICLSNGILFISRALDVAWSSS